MSTNYDHWHRWLENLESAEKFISLSFYWMISCALEKRVYIHGRNPYDPECIWPSMFFLFVGPPAAGKTRAALKAWDVLSQVKDMAGNCVYNKSPDSVSAAALLRELSESKRELKLPHVVDPFVYHALCVVCEEMGTLVKSNDTDTANSLIQLWDARGFKKKTIGADNFDLKSIIVNMIACTNPDWIKESFNQSLINQGYLSRFVTAYADAPRFMRDSFGHDDIQIAARNRVIAHVEQLSKLQGFCDFTKDAKAYRKYLIEDPSANYLKARGNPNPKLDYYYSRKRMHWFKLSMAMHFSESLEMIIDQPVMQKAFEFLSENEKEMEKIYDGMATNPLAKFNEQVLQAIQHSKSISFGNIWRKFSSDLNKRQMEEVMDFLRVSGKIMQDGDKFSVVRGKATTPSNVLPLGRPEVPDLQERIAEMRRAAK